MIHKYDNYNDKEEDELFLSNDELLKRMNERTKVLLESNPKYSVMITIDDDFTSSSLSSTFSY